MLWLDGLKYFRNNENRTNLFWRCHWYYRRIRCPVLICMNKFDINDFRQIHKHCHIKSTTKHASKEHMFKRTVVNNQEKPAQQETVVREEKEEQVEHAIQQEVILATEGDQQT